jgi:hypothetical protein
MGAVLAGKPPGIVGMRRRRIFSLTPNIQEVILWPDERSFQEAVRVCR